LSCLLGDAIEGDESQKRLAYRRLSMLLFSSRIQAGLDGRTLRHLNLRNDRSVQFNLDFPFCSTLVTSLDYSLISWTLMRNAPIVPMIGQQVQDVHLSSLGGHLK
jgi:hypothetical protein